MVDVGTASVTQVTTTGGSEPSWSPDGSSLAFGTGGHIYTMPLSGAPTLLDQGSCQGNFFCGGPEWAVVPPPAVSGCTPGPTSVCGTNNDDQVVISNGDASTGDGDDEILVNVTKDTTEVSVDAGTGDDDIILDASSLNTTYREHERDSAAAGGPIITVDTGSGKDSVVIRGALARQWVVKIAGGGAGDTIKAHTSKTPYGGHFAGYDLDGGGGDDKVIGGPGKDHVFGGSGNDNLEGSDGLDTLDGGPGEDTCKLDPGDIAKSCEHKRFSH
jgi:Ca2+-binding RTX toxin-like protein